MEPYSNPADWRPTRENPHDDNNHTTRGHFEGIYSGENQYQGNTHDPVSPQSPATTFRGYVTPAARPAPQPSPQPSAQQQHSLPQQQQYSSPQPSQREFQQHQAQQQSSYSSPQLPQHAFTTTPPQYGFSGSSPLPAMAQSQHSHRGYAAISPETPHTANVFSSGPESPGYFGQVPAPTAQGDLGHSSFGSPATPWETFPQSTNPRFLGEQTPHESQAHLLHHTRVEEVGRASPGYGQDFPRQKMPWRQRNAFFRFIAWWQGFWSQAWSMCAFLLAGFLFAAGHHVFYNNLNGKEADNQSRMLRYGTLLAFLAKANFVTSVILAFRQRVWMMVRRKILSLAAVDSLFAAAEDLSALFNWEALRSAKLAMCLAVYIWCTPLIVILTSETLSVTPRTQQLQAECPSIRTLNFSHEEQNEWRSPISIEGLYGLSVSLWNTTTDGGEPDVLDPNSFDYWTESSSQFKQLAWRAAYLQQATMRKDAPEQTCGAGWNCSFVIDFVAPAYKCEEVASGKGSKVKKLGKATAPFTTDAILPVGNYSYLAVTSQGDYADQQLDTGARGNPKMDPPYPTNFGAFRNEPIIWIGYAHVDDLSQRQPPNRTAKGWDTAYTPKIFGCEHYETQYSVQFNYTSGMQTYKVKKRDYLRKVIDTRYLPGQFANDGTMDNTTAIPTTNYVFPKDVANYRRIGAYHSLGKMMRSMINGTIAMPYYVVESDIIETRLLEMRNYLPVKNFRTEVERFYEEIILSLLSNPQFLAVSWASDPSKPTGVAEGGASSKYACTRSRTANSYEYRKMELWIVYAVAMVFATAGVVSGLVAIQEEGGVFRDNKFSSIVAATRGQSLNTVQWEGTKPKHVKVGFGMVPTHSGEKTAGFGLEGDVSQDRPVTARSPAIQMMEWGEKATRRVKTATGLR
ncbi:hypothetical protein B0J13DRAFT_554898 [Dactylonectria estremocensis]|uniref:Formylmethionine deformylase-like protein n=1 Tax=Dactylonectria estremocensis TaxID=1079267 RepID=A0A9P9ESS4_9HYPO|nr:hypothetical protein B0J13DRAFT_554898 [Dactylonectria estremocensis]